MNSKGIRYRKRGKLYIVSYQSQNTKKPLINSKSSKYQEEPPKYPEEVLKEFDETENFVSLSNNTKFIDYQNAQIILVGAREGKDVIKNKLNIEIGEQSPSQQQSADIFNKLKIRRDQVPVRPLTEGILE